MIKIMRMYLVVVVGEGCRGQGPASIWGTLKCLAWVKKRGPGGGVERGGGEASRGSLTVRGSSDFIPQTGESCR